MGKNSNNGCKRFEPSTPLKKIHKTYWEAGAQSQLDVWIHHDHIHWYYEANPQFSDGVEMDICQSFDEFLTAGLPDFAIGLDKEALEEIKELVT